MILLCNYGGDDRYINEIETKQQIIKLCKNKFVAIIVNAKTENNRQTDIEISKFLTNNNIKNKLYDLYGKDDSWQQADVIYFGGGSQLRLMNAIVENGYSDFNWGQKDIIGQSAGGMILFDKFCDCPDEKYNSPELKITDFKVYNGLGIIHNKKVFTPHYNTLASRIYGRTYLNFLEQNQLDSLNLNDYEYLLY